MNLKPGIYLTTDQVDGERLPCKTKSKHTYVLDTYTTNNYLSVFDECYLKEIVLILIIKNYDWFLFEFRKYRNIFQILPKNKKVNSLEIYKKFDKSKKGMEISFSPKIFDRLHTSLANPKMYLLKEEKLVNQIYKCLLKEELSFDDLKKKFKKEIKEEIDSLIYAQIIEIKNGKYFINQKLISCANK